jgi:hypothetical protein
MNSQDLAAWKAKRDAALQRANEKRAERSNGGGGQQYSNNHQGSGGNNAGGLSDFMPARTRYVLVLRCGAEGRKEFVAWVVFVSMVVLRGPLVRTRCVRAGDGAPLSGFVFQSCPTCAKPQCPEDFWVSWRQQRGRRQHLRAVVPSSAHLPATQQLVRSTAAAAAATSSTSSRAAATAAAAAAG